MAASRDVGPIASTCCPGASGTAVIASTSSGLGATTVASNGTPVAASAATTCGPAPYASVPPKNANTRGTPALSEAAGGTEGRRSRTSSRSST